MVLGGSCPGGNCPGGSCPRGVIALRGSRPRGSCPQGSCPRGSCPRGSCPKTDYFIHMAMNFIIEDVSMVSWQHMYYCYLQETESYRHGQIMCILISCW